METKIKTMDLVGEALDYAVSKYVGYASVPQWSPSTKWEQGGPIIEANNLELHKRSDDRDSWAAFAEFQVYGIGPTPLIAAMRCFVATRHGDYTLIPNDIAKRSGLIKEAE